MPNHSTSTLPDLDTAPIPYANQPTPSRSPARNTEKKTVTAKGKSIAPLNVHAQHTTQNEIDDSQPQVDKSVDITVANTEDKDGTDENYDNAQNLIHAVALHIQELGEQSNAQIDVSPMVEKNPKYMKKR